MCAKAYIKEKQVYLYFEDANKTSYIPVVYGLGASLTGFLRIETARVREIFDEVIKKTVNAKIGSHADVYKEHHNSLVDQTSEKSPYLNFYTGIMTGVLFSIARGKPYDLGPVLTLLPKVTEPRAEHADEILSRYYDPAYLENRTQQQKEMLLKSLSIILNIKNAVLADIDAKKASISTKLEVIYETSEGTSFDELNNSQKLLVSGSKLANSDFSVKYKPFSDDGMIKEADIDTSSITPDYVLKHNIDIHETYDIPWIDDIISLEFLKMIENDIVIKRCNNCGNLFAPAGRIDTIYCNEPYMNTMKTCVEIGAVKKYKEKTMQDPAHEAFNKAYKRNNSRVRTNRMTKKDFNEWSEKARTMRHSCLQGNIGLDEFSNWLGNKK